MAKEMVFNKAKTHTRYYVNGKRVPGATTIAGQLDKPALKYWANRLGLDGYEVDAYVDPLADAGTLAHKMVENYYRKLPTDTSEYPEKVIKAAEWATISFLKWEEQHEIEILGTEMQLTSQAYRYGGTCDIYAVVDDMCELIDLKTGKAIYADYGYQVAAYRNLLTENDFPVERVRILNIPRSEGERFDEWVLTDEELEAAWGVFVRLREVYDLRKVVKR